MVKSNPERNLGRINSAPAISASSKNTQPKARPATESKSRPAIESKMATAEGDPEFDLAEAEELEVGLFGDEVDDVGFPDWSILSNPVEMYRLDVSRNSEERPLLTREQEVDLSQRYRAGRAAEQELTASASRLFLSETELVQLINNRDIQISGDLGKRIQQKYPGKLPNELETLVTQVQDGHLARNTLIESNVRLVYSLALRFGYELELPDRIQEGNLGLMRAIEKFDPTLGYKFSTYAVWWIKQAIARAGQDKARLIKVPVHAQEDLRHLNRIVHQAEQYEEYGLNISKELDKLKEAGVDQQRRLENYALYRSGRFSPLSMEAAFVTNEDGSLEDLIEDKTANIESSLMSFDLRHQFNQIFDQLELSDRQREVISKRFGLGNDEAKTLEQIGHELGITRERVRQIEIRIMDHLKSPKIKRLLEPYREP